MYRECLRYPNLSFVWNTKVTGLMIESQRVVGVRGIHQRSGQTNEFRAAAVILATGGTIAGVASTGTQAGYTSGAVTIDAMLAAVPGIKDLANVKGE